MKQLIYHMALQSILRHAAAEGRKEALFGRGYEHAKDVLPAFIRGDTFPHIQLEFPLAGDPFLDASMLYQQDSGRVRIDSPTVAGTEGVIDWISDLPKDYQGIIWWGYELDMGSSVLPTAGIHFQPWDHPELAEQFCRLIGEEEKGRLYLSSVDRMPAGWEPVYFGIFRGRKNAPLRIGGYLGTDVRAAAARSKEVIRQVFQKTGFTAYDDTMLEQLSLLLGEGVEGMDFQFDVLPDGSLAEKFSVGLMLGIRGRETAKDAFNGGVYTSLRRSLEEWKIIDDRLDMALDMTYTKKQKVLSEEGSVGYCMKLLLPSWLKVSWIHGRLQPAKLYCLVYALIR